MSHKEAHEILNRLTLALSLEGWAITAVIDEEDEETKTPTAGAVRDVVFDLDISFLTVENKHGDEHRIMFIPENGRDAVSDWSYTSDDPDGFNSVMDRFIDQLIAEE